MRRTLLRILVLISALVICAAAWSANGQSSIERTAELLQQGIDALQAAQYEQALEYLNEALDTNESVAVNSGVYFLRGYAYFALNEWEAAADDLIRQVQLDPDGETYLMLGAAYTELRELDLAIESLTQAIDLGMTDGTAHYYRATAYIYAGEYEQALDDYEVVIENNAETPEMYLGQALAFEGLDRTEEAAESLWQYTELMLEVLNTEMIEVRAPLVAGTAITVDMEPGIAYLYSFSGDAGDNVTVSAEASRNTQNDPLLLLLDEEMQPLVGNDDISEDNFNAEIEDFSLPTDGVYYVVVTHAASVQEGEIDVMLTSE